MGVARQARPGQRHRARPFPWPRWIEPLAETLLHAQEIAIAGIAPNPSAALPQISTAPPFPYIPQKPRIARNWSVDSDGDATNHRNSPAGIDPKGGAARTTTAPAPPRRKRPQNSVSSSDAAPAGPTAGRSHRPSPPAPQNRWE